MKTRWFPLIRPKIKALFPGVLVALGGSGPFQRIIRVCPVAFILKAHRLTPCGPHHLDGSFGSEIFF